MRAGLALDPAPRRVAETFGAELSGMRIAGDVSDAEVADLELRYARAFQSKDPVIFSRVDIIESQIDEGLAAERKENAEAVRKIRDDLTRVDLDLIAIDRRKADLKIDEARTGLLALEVRAPHDGIFVLKRDWRGTAKVGDTVTLLENRATEPLPGYRPVKPMVFCSLYTVAGDDYGRPTDLPWAVTFRHPDAADIGGAPLGIPLHPVQLYESLACLILFFILVGLARNKRFNGEIILAYSSLYALARYFLEFLRGDVDRGFVLGGLLSTSQAVAVVTLIVCIPLFVKRKRA